MVREASYTGSFDIDKITYISWLEKIVSNGYAIILHQLFDLESMKRFEGRSDVCLG